MCSSSRPTCSSIVAVLGGSRPRNPKTRRSPASKPVSLLSNGRVRSSAPRNGTCWMPAGRSSFSDRGSCLMGPAFTRAYGRGNVRSALLDVPGWRGGPERTRGLLARVRFAREQGADLERGLGAGGIDETSQLIRGRDHRQQTRGIGARDRTAAIGRRGESLAERGEGGGQRPRLLRRSDAGGGDGRRHEQGETRRRERFTLTEIRGQPGVDARNLIPEVLVGRGRAGGGGVRDEPGWQRSGQFAGDSVDPQLDVRCYGTWGGVCGEVGLVGHKTVLPGLRDYCGDAGSADRPRLRARVDWPGVDHRNSDVAVDELPVGNRHGREPAERVLG